MRRQDIRIIDMHAHILPAMDDGAKTPEESLEMAKKAYEAGVRGIIATPHRYPGDQSYSVREITEKTEQLNGQIDTWLKEQGYDEPLTVYPGQEIYWYEGLPDDLAAGRALTLAGSSCVLTEYSYESDYDSIFRAVRRLTDAGYTPVIAHMERYPALDIADNVEELLRAGALLSMNYQTAAGDGSYAETRRAREYLREGAIAMLGSDMHNTTSRPPEYGTALEWMRRKLPEGQIYGVTWAAPMEIIREGT